MAKARDNQLLPEQMTLSREALTSLLWAGGRDKLVVIKTSFLLVVIIIYHVLENINNKLNGYQNRVLINFNFDIWMLAFLNFMMSAICYTFMILIIRPQLLLRLQRQGKEYRLWYKQEEFKLTCICYKNLFLYRLCLSLGHVSFYFIFYF